MTAPKAQQDAPWICLGKITKPFGIRGGVRIHLYNPDSETLQPGLNVELRHAASNKSIAAVIKTHHGGGRVVFQNFSDRNTVEELRNHEVWIQRSALPPIDENEAYLIDFLQAEVLNQDEKILGTIIKIDINTPQPLATVKTPSGKCIDMPFVAGLITRLCEEEKKVWIDEPEGLFSGEPVIVPEMEKKRK